MPKKSQSCEGNFLNKKTTSKFINIEKSKFKNPRPLRESKFYQTKLLSNQSYKKINENLKKVLEKKLFNLFQKKFLGIYMFGSVGVGKSLILKAIHLIYSKSEIFHFTDLMFNLQNLHDEKFRSLMMKKKLILIDEFYINNLTNSNIV